VRAVCAVCRQPVPDDEGPDDFREGVFDNGLIVQVCLRCWFLWPAARKTFPAFGYGRVGDEDEPEEFALSAEDFIAAKGEGA
jgi:hypothetical protein